MIVYTRETLLARAMLSGRDVAHYAGSCESLSRCQLCERSLNKLDRRYEKTFAYFCNWQAAVSGGFYGVVYWPCVDPRDVADEEP